MKVNYFNGWLFLDKPVGITSNFALQKIRKIFKNSKAGFVGTLDPLASGFLPIALGSATKIITYIEKEDKEYLFTIRWGVKTETGDSEGKIIKTKNKYPVNNKIISVLRNFIGWIEQSPHQYSSVKINGFRAYQLARENIPFKTKKRMIKISDIKFIKSISDEIACFYLKCSAGTYVRSLAESLAEALGTLGSVIELRRVGVGNFNKKLISLDYLLSLVHSDDLNKAVYPIDIVFNKVSKIQLDEKQMKKILTGSFIEMNNDFVEELKNRMVFAKYENNFVAFGLIKKRNFYPKKLLIT